MFIFDVLSGTFPPHLPGHTLIFRTGSVTEMAIQRRLLLKRLLIGAVLASPLSAGAYAQGPGAGDPRAAVESFNAALLAAMKAGETVGILMDTNMTPPQGVFVNFFGIPAGTASGLARIALRTDAAVVPGFTIWDQALGKYRLRFDPALELIRSGDLEADLVANTQMFTKVIEDYVRKYPDQWLWVHRRWKTRPEGQPGLY